MIIGDEITGRVERIAFGGAGIVRHLGFVIFVPFTLIGELVKIKISAVKKSFAQGELLELLESDESRKKAKCSYFGSCGGCQFQHMSYAQQIKAKKGFIEDALQRIGKIHKKLDGFIEASIHFAYRKRIRLKISKESLGYVGEDFKFLPISSCHLFHEIEDPIIQEIANFISAQALNGHVTVFKAERYILFFEVDHIPEHFPKMPTLVQGIIFKDAKKEVIFGNVKTEIEVLGKKFDCSPRSFIQNHQQQSEKLYKTVVALIEKMDKKDTILDLYCGFGITSSLIAEKFGSKVIGVECSQEAIELAKRNGQHCQFICERVENILPELLKKQPNLVIVNPPRVGLDPLVIQNLIKAQIENMIYISCMPSTLARDLKQFVDNGYVLDTCIGCDMFPQTSHVETIAFVKLNTDSQRIKERSKS